MKPIKLTMSAFGSYADVQEIDFSALGANGLYLITGETGSGKTTIFDAISFALFGKASGTGRDDYSMLRSDFAPAKARTYVELDFVSGGSRYTIKRAIKKSGQEVTLILPDGTSMSGDRNIKPKIAEIAGLDRDQFAQIVMIAQNDFLRFLQSGTDDRLKILRRIFGTEALKQFQEQLKARVRRESDRHALILHDFERYELDVYQRDAQFSVWEAQIRSDKTDLSETDKKLADQDKLKQTLSADLAIAEELGRKFDALGQNQFDREAHDAKAGEIRESKTRADRSEIALYKIKPLYEEAQKAAVNHSTAQTDLANAKEQETAAVVESGEAAKMEEGLPPLAAAQDAFAALSKEWEAAASRLKQLTDLQANRKDIVDKQVLLAEKQEDLGATLEGLSQIPSAADEQAELDKILLALQNNEEKLTKLSAIQSDLAVITDGQAELAREQADFEACTIRFREADEQYRALEEAFLRNQAGILAQNLIDGEACPVCGSTVHPMPAGVSGADVTEAKLKKARETKEKEQAKREKQATACAARKTEIETQLKRFIADLSALIPAATMETAKDLLIKGMHEARLARTELSGKKISAEKILEEHKSAFETLTDQRAELTKDIASLQGEIDTLVKRFMSDIRVFISDAKWESSDTELNRLLAQAEHSANELSIRKETDEPALKQLSLEWEAAIERKTKAASALQSAQTRVTERAANEQKWRRLHDEAQAAYQEVLQNNHFADDAEYLATLITEEELIEQKRQVSEYEKQGEQLLRDIARLESEIAGKEKPDIEGLRRKAEAVNAETKMLNEQRDEINSRLSKIESALKDLRRSAADFEKVEKAYAAVKQLADTANGKLDFETYAQMAYFERVLRAANQRLQVMSQNRYTLLRKTESDDGRRRSGLDLAVLDAYTGKARSANSLSGGESFMASLSLALGLSDVVQQSAGGIRLDAMFIDEGFGTLDADVLELAVRTLSEMAGTNRIIGIISHVAELRERIDKQIQVEKTTTGSKILLAV